MNTIDEYKRLIKIEIKRLGGKNDIIDEYLSHLEAEWEDFKNDFELLPEEELERRFIKNHDHPKLIAISLIGKIPKYTKTPGGYIKRGLLYINEFYSNLILDRKWGYQITFFVLWLIPGIFIYIATFSERLFDFQTSRFLYSIMTLFLIQEIEVNLFILQLLSGFYEHIYTYGYFSIPLLLIYIGFIFWINKRNSVKYTFSNIIVVSLAYCLSMLPIYLDIYYRYFGGNEVHSLDLWLYLRGDLFIFTSMISLGIILSIFIIIYQWKFGELTGSYLNFVQKIKKSNNQLLFGLIFFSILMLPKLIDNFIVGNSYTTIIRNITLLTFIVGIMICVEIFKIKFAAGVVISTVIFICLSVFAILSNVGIVIIIFWSITLVILHFYNLEGEVIS